MMSGEYKLDIIIFLKNIIYDYDEIFAYMRQET